MRQSFPCSSPPWREARQSGDILDQVALAIDDEDGCLPSGNAIEIAGDEGLKRLGLAVARPRHNPMMLEAGALGE